MATAKDRRLIVGVDVSTWADVKLQRANGLFNELHAAIGLWNAGRPYKAPIRFSEDRTAVEALAPAMVRPPLDDWSVLLGDAVGNVRAALDAAAWDLAHVDGSTPKKERTVRFPVTRTREAWARARREMQGSMEDVFLDRIAARQPWATETPDEQIHLLDLIDELSNNSKHRGSIRGIPLVASARIEGMQIRVEGEGGEIRFGIDPATQMWNGTGVADETTAGEPIARFEFGGVIDRSSSIPDTADMSVGVLVAVRDQAIPLGAVHNAGLAHVAETIEYLWHGGHEERATFPIAEPGGDKA